MLTSLTSVLLQLEPDIDGLLSSLGNAIRDPDLRSIAECDYGIDIEENLAALRSIRESGVVPYPLPWNPKEVCELTRWAPPDTFHPSQVRTARNPEIAASRRRAFACAILLRSAADDQIGYLMGENSTGAALVGSSLVLANEHPNILSESARALAAVILSRSRIGDDERLLLALGVLVCVTADRPHANAPIAGEVIRLLGEAILVEELNLRESDEDCNAWSSDWLLGLTNHNQRHPLWRSLAQHVLLDPEVPHPHEADVVLKHIGSLLVSAQPPDESARNGD